jgi:hypothetical protein
MGSVLVLFFHTFSLLTTRVGRTKSDTLRMLGLSAQTHSYSNHSPVSGSVTQRDRAAL